MHIHYTRMYIFKKWLGVCYMYNQLVITAKETRGGSRVGCLGDPEGGRQNPHPYKTEQSMERCMDSNAYFFVPIFQFQSGKILPQGLGSGAGGWGAIVPCAPPPPPTPTPAGSATMSHMWVVYLQSPYCALANRQKASEVQEREP